MKWELETAIAGYFWSMEGVDVELTYCHDDSWPPCSIIRNINIHLEVCRVGAEIGHLEKCSFCYRKKRREDERDAHTAELGTEALLGLLVEKLRNGRKWLPENATRPS